MKQILRLTLSIICYLSLSPVWAQSDRFQCDDSCDPDATGIVKYNVVNPVGFSTIEPIKMVPRLTTLEDKTIAIVGEDFMYNITHPELKRLIQEYYHSARVIMYDELPIAGPYPAPGITRQSTDLFRQRLIDLKVASQLLVLTRKHDTQPETVVYPCCV